MAGKKWNWQQPDWPAFSYDFAALENLEREFVYQAGVYLGISKSLRKDDLDGLRIELLSNEAAETSAIEGEILRLESIQLSLKREFGLVGRYTRFLGLDPGNSETGIARLMIQLHEDFQTLLTKEELFRWHEFLMAGNPHLDTIGAYRTHADDMIIATLRNSGPDRVHFVAPSSTDVPGEMEQFINWFNKTSPAGDTPLPPLTRAGIAHLYFISIHPFEDGNGRIGRALAEKAIYQNLGVSLPLSLSTIINQKRNLYYDQIANHNRTNEITGWLRYFAETAIAAKLLSLQRTELVVNKYKFFRAYRDLLNHRQKKLIAKLCDNISKKRFQQGITEYTGSFKAPYYMGLTKISSSTATRDLNDLVDKGVLIRSGERKGSQYRFPLDHLIADLNRHGRPR